MRRHLLLVGGGAACDVDWRRASSRLPHTGGYAEVTCKNCMNAVQREAYAREERWDVFCREQRWAAMASDVGMSHVWEYLLGLPRNPSCDCVREIGGTFIQWLHEDGFRADARAEEAA